VAGCLLASIGLPSYFLEYRVHRLRCHGAFDYEHCDAGTPYTLILPRALIGQGIDTPYADPPVAFFVGGIYARRGYFAWQAEIGGLLVPFFLLCTAGYITFRAVRKRRLPIYASKLLAGRESSRPGKTVPRGRYLLIATTLFALAAGLPFYFLEERTERERCDYYSGVRECEISSLDTLLVYHELITGGIDGPYADPGSIIYDKGLYARRGYTASQAIIGGIAVPFFLICAAMYFAFRAIKKQKLKPAS
jgi:hypothetical protein